VVLARPTPVLTDGLFRSSPGPGISHLQTQESIVALGKNLDCARPGPRCDAMLNGVFDQRLEKKRRHFDIQNILGKYSTECQPVPQTHLLDIKVGPDEIEFFGQRDLLLASTREHFAQQFPETQDQIVPPAVDPDVPVRQSSAAWLNRK